MRNNGFTFIEILIAMVVTGIVAYSIFVCLNLGGKLIRQNANKTTALNYAQELMEEMKNEDYAAITDSADTVNMYQSAASSVPAARNATVTDCVDYKEIEVSVAWTAYGKNYTESISSIIYNDI